jgi:hypothetical protein
MEEPEQQDPITMGTAQQITESCIQKDKTLHKTKPNPHTWTQIEDDVISDHQHHYQHCDDPALQEEEEQKETTIKG